MCFYRMVVLIVASLWACTLAASSPQEESRRYQAPKDEVPEPVRDSRTMGSVVPASSGSLRLAYDVPEGWVPGRVGGMRKAAFVVRDGEREVEITAIDLVARAGALLPNVNRWRAQIQLGKITQSELDKAVVPIQVAGVEGHYVELVGSREADTSQAILAVVVIQGGKAWFFKLRGDAELALREKGRFQDFVRSVKFGAAGEAEDGD